MRSLYYMIFCSMLATHGLALAADEFDQAFPREHDFSNESLEDVMKGLSNSLAVSSGACSKPSSQQCAAEQAANIAQVESKISYGLARSLGLVAIADESLLKKENDLRQRLADVQQRIQKNAQDRNDIANQNPNSGNNSGSNGDKGKGKGGQGGGGASGGGGPAQNAGLQPSKGNELDRAGETQAVQRPNEQPMDFGQAGGFQVGQAQFDPNLGNNQTFAPSLFGSPNRAASTSADLQRAGGGRRNFFGGKSSGLQPIQAKPNNPAAEAAKAGAGGGAAPGLAGGGAPKSDVGGPPPVGEQEMEPAPPLPKKVAVEFAAAGGAEGNGNSEGNGGDGDEKGEKPQQVAPPRTQLALGPGAGNRAEKRTGHGILDYVGYISDSCHDKTEAMLGSICARGKQPPTAISGSASTVANATPDRLPASVPDAAAVAALAPVTGSVGSVPSSASKVDLGLVKDGLERAFSRRLPEQSL